MMTADDECDMCLNYVSVQTDSSEWQCELCQLKEIRIDGVEWTRVKAQCGHQFHTRCYSKWAKIVDKVGCILCGVLQKIDNNLYCNTCKNYGHSQNKCPVDLNVQVKGYITSEVLERYGRNCR
jgi:hypothetical protein